MRSRWVLVVLPLLVVIGVEQPVEAGRCRGAFRRSCLNQLYRCFDAQGSCQVQRIEVPGQPGGHTVTCFANGAHVVTTVGLGSPGTSPVYASTEFTNAAGEKCVSTYSITDPARGTTDIDLVNVQSGQNWRMLYTRNALYVYCPGRRGRRRERYSLRQVRNADCGSGNGNCVEGDCGF